MGGTGDRGRFFEDFQLGDDIVHATPRTVTTGDVALYTALTGTRFALFSSDEFARAVGLACAPVDDLLVFHLVFGRTVGDVSINAVANLGYAGGVFGAAVYPGDTLRARSEIVGVKENADARAGIVYVRSLGLNQRDEVVLEYVRWVMVPKRDPGAPAPEPRVPELPDAVEPAALVVPAALRLDGYDAAAAGSPDLWDDWAVGTRTDHVDGMTIEEAEHMMATRLYQNPARVHFDQHLAKAGRFGRRIVYGGHVISLARALTFNGLANGFKIAAVNAGRHVAPAFAGDTVYAWSEVVEKAEIPGRGDAGALRLRTVATKDRPAAAFPDRGEDGGYDASVILDFDYWVLMPRRG